MKLAADQISTAEARAMLDQLPQLYFAVLKGTYIEQPNEAEVRCSFELPFVGKRTVTAPTALEAIRAMILEVTDVLAQTLPQGRHGSVQTLSPTLEPPPILRDDKGVRFQGKARQVTIGVTMPLALKAHLQGFADRQHSFFAEVARQIAGMGFDDFDERTYTESTERLFYLLSTEVRQWQPADTEQVMIRLDPRMAVKIRGAAKEHRRSSSEFGAMCLAHGLAVLENQLNEIANSIALYKGPAARKLAPKLGLGTHVELLSGIFAGSIRAPKQVLKKLSEVFLGSELALSEFFNRTYAARGMPAFKADKGKPQVSTATTSWADAIQSLHLPADQAKALLQLDE